VKNISFLLAILLTAGVVYGQQMNYEKISKEAVAYTVIINIKMEISLGTQTTEAQSRSIGTLVSPEGLVLFDGIPLDSDNPFSMMAGMQINTKPKSIEITMMDGTKYPAEFVGVDKFTKIGFCKIKAERKINFRSVVFKKRVNIRVGEWLTLYSLMPEFVDPPLASDIGMVSSLIKVPENFVLTVGFNENQLSSVLYDRDGNPVGVLGQLDNGGMGSLDASRMPSFSQSEQYLPLLGLIGADKLERLINDPPTPGKIDRGWLGVYLQALTPDIADFWGIKTSGGIIINEVAKESPADSAGFKTGDIIARMNDKAININKEENLPVFQREIVDMGAGAHVAFEVLRRNDGKVDTLDLRAVLARAPLTPSEVSSYEDSNFSLIVRDMAFADYNLYNLDRREFNGVVVKEVEAGGWASVGEIMPGDIIQAIGGQKISSVTDARTILTEVAANKPKEVVFFIWRDNKTTFVNVKTEW